MPLYALIRPLLFRLPPESAHRRTLALLAGLAQRPWALRWLQRLYAGAEHPVQVFGLRFSSPFGLAAGYDKDAEAVLALAALGFGHIEVGTVTPKPQPGNPAPRLFRLPAEKALINRLGFPSLGADVVAGRLAGLPRRRSFVLGVNIGKNKETPLEEAAGDYLQLYDRFCQLADYLVVNVSSPNTAGLRDLQHRARLESLLGQLAAHRAKSSTSCPLLVKFSPDLTASQLELALEAAVRTGMDGVILTNTTVSRPGVRSASGREQGGLSGAPLRQRSEAALRQALHWLDGRLPVISVGGVLTPEDAIRRLEMGAALVQMFTGLVYYGPSLVRASTRLLTRSVLLQKE